MQRTDLELALDTFGIPSEADFSDSDYDYAVGRLRSGDDQDLAALHDHLIGRDAQDNNGQIRQAWYGQGNVSDGAASLAALVALRRGFRLA